MRTLIALSLVLILACGSEEEPMVNTPRLSIDALSIAEGESDKSIFITLRLSALSSETVTASISTKDNTAQAGEDYEALTDQIVQFEPGDVQESISLTILGDDISEDDESFFIVVDDVTGADAEMQQVEIIIENDDISYEVIIPQTGYMTGLTHPGKQLVWNQEFDEDELDENVWTHEIGNGPSGWGNNELQYYRKENTQIIDGNLVIQAREENFGGFRYTSSRIITENKFEFTYGRVDVRAVVPGDQGIWPAFWMLGANIREVSWPRCGEIDILEQVGHTPNINHGTIHYSNSAGNRILNTDTYKLLGNQKFSDQFHVFSLEWDEEKIRFYVNDNLYHTIFKNNLAQADPYPFDEPFFFIANVAVGGNWPGSPDGTTSFPKNLIIDYIRVFQ